MSEAMASGEMRETPRSPVHEPRCTSSMQGLEAVIRLQRRQTNGTGYAPSVPTFERTQGWPPSGSTGFHHVEEDIDMDDRHNSGTSKKDQGGMSGSPGRTGSSQQGDQQSGAGFSGSRGAADGSSGGLSGSSVTGGSIGQQGQSGRSTQSGRSAQSGQTSQSARSGQSGGIRDDASAGEGAAGSGSQRGGMRAPSGSDELDGDVSRTGQSGQSGRSGMSGSPSDTRSSGKSGSGGGSSTSR